jgi:NADPH:quinone reductase-like Zn-dependent oxidoreductase
MPQLSIGARVIGTVSTEEKAKLARDAGADDIILYTQSDFEIETRKLTDGHGVDVVYDSVGKTTFEKGLNVLRPRGYMVLFGGSSGAVPPFDLIQLSQKGSLYVTRPTLAHYIATREDLEWRSGDVFGMIAAGKLKLRIDHTYPLQDRTQLTTIWRAEDDREIVAVELMGDAISNLNAKLTRLVVTALLLGIDWLARAASSDSCVWIPPRPAPPSL